MASSNPATDADVSVPPHDKPYFRKTTTLKATAIVATLACFIFDSALGIQYDWQTVEETAGSSNRAYVLVFLAIVAGLSFFFRSARRSDFGLVALCVLLSLAYPSCPDQGNPTTWPVRVSNVLHVARKVGLALSVASAGYHWFLLLRASREFQNPARSNSDVKIPPAVIESTASNDEYSKASGPGSSDNSSEKEHKGKKTIRDMLWSSVKLYSVLVPYLMPKHDRTLMVCLVAKFVCVAVSRALTVLVSRQVGIVTDKLMNTQSQPDEMPLKEILIWFGLRWLDSNAGIDLVSGLASTIIQRRISRRVVSAAFDHMMGLSMSFHENEEFTETSRAVAGGRQLASLLDTWVFRVAPRLLDMIVAYIYLFTFVDFKLTSIVLVASVAYISMEFVFSKCMGTTERTFHYATADQVQGTKESRKKYHDDFSLTRKLLYGAVEGWTTAWHFSRLDHESSRFAASANQQENSESSYRRSQNLREAAADLVFNAAFACCVLLITYQVSRGELQVGSLMQFMVYWNSIAWPLQNMVMHYQYLSEDLAEVDCLLKLLQTQPTVTEKPNAYDLPPGPGHVAFKHVDFAYDTRKPVLQDIDIQTSPGTQTIALVGETGSGKSTIFKLLSRLYDVTAGAITIDGHDIRDVTLSGLRDAIGVVPQDPHLSPTSIKKNLLYARLDATDEDIHAACRAACIHDRILSFPDGYGSAVGKRGVKLSGGERQRLAIARVLLKDSRVVLLDEATSSVDTDTEARIQAALDRLCAGKTTLVIAHRLSTVVRADVILVLEGGRVVERGTHAQLLRDSRVYRNLWVKQIAPTGVDAGEADQKPCDGEATPKATAKNNTTSDSEHPVHVGESDGAEEDDGASESSFNLRGEFLNSPDGDHVGNPLGSGDVATGSGQLGSENGLAELLDM